jgi:hemerythrin-like domain-containing protein
MPRRAHYIRAMNDDGLDRRVWLAGAAGALVLARGALAAARPEKTEEKKEADIPPTEDLMREHGVLRRILIVYDEASRRLASEDAAALAVVGSAAGIVRQFVEGYHEKLEEQFVLPALEKAGKLVDLAKIIRTQHAAGRKLTDTILAATKSKDRRGAVTAMQSFSRMYAAHAAWEDTDVFPAYRGMYSEAELDKLGDKFEDQEHKLLGAGGFEGSLREVGDLEKTLGIHDLAKFTPA